MTTEESPHISVPYAQIIRERHPGNPDLIALVNTIEPKLLENLRYFEPGGLSGVKLPFTHVTIGLPEGHRNRIEVLCPGINATPFTWADFIFERARIAQSRKDTVTTVVSLGQPNSQMGMVTQDWITAQKKATVCFIRENHTAVTRCTLPSTEL